MDYKMRRIGLIGDRDESVSAHVAIPLAFDLACASSEQLLDVVWQPTDELKAQDLSRFDGLWCVPASPYRDTDSAMAAIRFARENNVPFLGTCGGFQHALLEYAQNVLGMVNVEHAELNPDSQAALISPLACELVEKSESVRLVDASLMRQAYGREYVDVTYRCRYGLNPEFVDRVTAGNLKVSAYGVDDSIRGMELQGHRFFVVTLFQPEREALVGKLPAIVKAFVDSVCE